MSQYGRPLSVPPEDVDAVSEFLQTVWADNPQIPSGVQIAFETAVIELVTNIILYSVATNGVECELKVEVNEDQINATISDNGAPAELVLNEHTMPDEFSESGRGIPLMRALVDEFSFDTSEDTNTWKMSKRFES